jgi:hypothetical protein
VHLRVRGGEAGQAAEAMRCCLLASSTFVVFADRCANLAARSPVLGG